MSNSQFDFEQARAKHLLFKSRLRSILYGAIINEEPVLSQYECGVGKWIYEYALKQYNNLPEMQELEKVHADIHVSARELVKLYKEGKVEEARKGLTKMDAIADKLVSLLTIIQSKVETEQSQINSYQTDSETSKELQDLIKTNDQLDKKIREQSGELTNERQMLHDFFMQAPAIFAIIKGPDHVFEFANEAYFNITGNRPLIGKTVLEAIPEIKGQGFMELLDNVYKTGTPFIAKETPVSLERNGKTEIVFIDFSYIAFKNSGGQIEGILVFAYEVTDKVNIRKKIKESEQQFIDLAENMPQLAWMADDSGWIFWYNKQWYSYTNTTPEQMEGWGWQSVHDPETLPKVLENWKKSIESGVPFEMVFPLKGADNVFRPFLTRVIPLKDSNGKITTWFGTNTDITEQKKTEDALRESERRLKQSFEDLETKVRFRNLELEKLNKEYKTKIDELQRKN